MELLGIVILMAVPAIIYAVQDYREELRRADARRAYQEWMRK